MLFDSFSIFICLGEVGSLFRPSPFSNSPDTGGEAFALTRGDGVSVKNLFEGVEIRLDVS